MTIREIEIPKLDYGYVPKALDTMSVSLPANKKLVISPTRFENNSYYQGKGIIRNHNQSSLNWNTYIPNFNERARFIPAPELQNFVIHPKNWTDAQYIQFANSIASSNPVKVLTSSWNEADYSNPYAIFGQNIGQAQASQYKWYKALGNAYRANGGEFFGDYSGLPRLNSTIYNDITSDTNARNLLNNLNNSLNRARALNEFCPDYLNTDLHNYLSWNFNGYFMQKEGGYTPRFSEIISSMLMNKNAMMALGNTTAKSMGFFYSSNVETNLNGPNTGYAENYRRPLSVGGYVECWDSPSYSFKMQLALTIYSLMEMDYTKWWGNSRTWTVNENVIGPDIYRQGDNFPLFKYYGSGNPSRSTPVDNDLKGYDNGYYEKPYGHDDAMIVGANLYGKATTWTNNTNFIEAQTRRAGIGSYSLVEQAALPIAALNETVHCKYSINQNRLSLIGYSFSDIKETFEIKIANGTIVPITVFGNSPFVICVDLN
jgi:hypothetical protein